MANLVRGGSEGRRLYELFEQQLIEKATGRKIQNAGEPIGQARRKKKK